MLVLTPGRQEPEPGQGSEDACQAPRSGMPLNACVPGRLAHVQDEPAAAPSDNVWHEIKRLSRGWAFLIAQLVKNPPVIQETLVRFLGRKDLLEKG
ncbi:unnamed protein product [Rangifer tarandus platyrhynchus]|uniref:Uncharacterized protein n=1 Tax=Rangifer tarandus platyrhynchus TaxID=3082113 RepID=A0AC59YFQ2_RANTA